MARIKTPVLFPPTVFNVYKPVGITSSDVIYHFKKNLPQGFGKIGHFGTLDPFAEGVLLVGIAGAARLSDYVHRELPKTYRAIGILGQKTSTGDLTVSETEVIYDLEIEKLKDLKFSDLESVLSSFCGIYQQVPPQYSAVKHKGKALYEYARKGVEIIKDPVEREIFSIKLLRFDFPEVEFEVTVSSGTYIRTLFENIAEKLHTYGVLKSLKRVSVGHVHIEKSLLKENWPKKESCFNLETYSLPLKSLLPYRLVELNEDESIRIKNGNPVKIDLEDGFYWGVDSEKNLLCLGKVEDSIFKISINFNPPYAKFK